MENDDENIHVDIGALRVSIQFQPTVSKLKAMRIREMIIKKRIACEKNFPYQYRWRIIEIGMKNMIRRRKGFGNEAPSTVQHAHISLKTVTKMRDKKLFHTHTYLISLNSYEAIYACTKCTSGSGCKDSNDDQTKHNPEHSKYATQNKFGSFISVTEVEQRQIKFTTLYFQNGGKLQ